MAATAAAGPLAMIPTKANWEPPENNSSDRTWVCHRVRPEAVESAPKLMPYAPVATDDRQRLAQHLAAPRVGQRAGGRRHGPVVAGRWLGRVGSASVSGSREGGDQPHLAGRVAVGRHDAVPERAVGAQARGQEEGPGRLVAREQPRVHGARARAAEGVDGGVEQPRPVPGVTRLGCTPSAVSSPVSWPASGSWLGPRAAKPTTWSPAHATSSRYTPAGGAASERRQAPAKAAGSKAARASAGTTSAYASRHTTDWTRPTAGASLSRARRTLASASGPGPAAVGVVVGVVVRVAMGVVVRHGAILSSARM